MSDPSTIVQRRFPTYDFVTVLAIPPKAASDLLDQYIQNHQRRPRGFVFTDPRVDGTVAGSSFSFRRRESGFGGPVSPYVEGYFVPEHGGTHMYVSVQMPKWWWIFDSVFVAIAFTSFISAGNVGDLGVLAAVIVFLLALTVAPIWYEASQVKSVLTRVFASSPSAVP